MNPPDDEKRIIIDEDWKSQVEKERAQLRTGAESDTADPVKSAGESSSESGTGGPAASDRGPLPPADFEFLVSSIATQSFIALGLMPDPFTGQTEPDSELAKHHIDMLEMLEEKTQGNLTPDEAQMISSILHQLRVTYVSSGLN